MSRLFAAALAGLIASTPLAPALAAAGTGIQTFHSPTGNTGCRYDPTPRYAMPPTLTCDVVGGVPRDPSAPYSACPGHQLGYQLQGRDPEEDCNGPSALHSGPVLPYGKTWSAGPFTCTSRETGLTCTNQHGLGFFLALGEGHVIDPFGDRNYAATPQKAVVDVLGRMKLNDRPDDLRPVRVDRVNVAGPYAVVVTSNGEYSPDAQLVEHFPFGWQVISDLNTCLLSVRGIGAADRQILMSGVPELTKYDHAWCSDDFADRGPQSDIEAIRKLTTDWYVSYAGVAGDFGYAIQSGMSGSCAFFHRVNGAWALVAGCKGGFDLDYLKRFGFTQQILCELIPGKPDKECPNRR